MKITVPKVFAIVTLAALVGGAMGGVFGYAQGLNAPQNLGAGPVSPQEASVRGAWQGSEVGIILGGGLGVFSVCASLASGWIGARRGS